MSLMKWVKDSTRKLMTVSDVDGDQQGPLPVDVVAGNVTLEAGDIQIGAVELKDHTSNDRAGVTGSTPATSATGLNTREVPTSGTPTETADATVGAAASTILAANAARKSAAIQNTGTANARVSLSGVNPTASQGLRLMPGQILVLRQPYVETGAVKAIREGSSDTTVAVMETV